LVCYNLLHYLDTQLLHRNQGAHQAKTLRSIWFILPGQLGSGGKLPGELDYCHHLAVGPSGSIYVAEVKNWRIQKFVAKVTP